MAGAPSPPHSPFLLLLSSSPTPAHLHLLSSNRWQGLVVEEALGGWPGNSAGRPGMACGGAGPTCLPRACDLALGKQVFLFLKKRSSALFAECL